MPDYKNTIHVVYRGVSQFISQSASLCIKDANDSLLVKINRHKGFCIHDLWGIVTLLFI